MTTTLNLPDDLVEDIQARAAQKGRGLDETIAELLRAGLAVELTRPATLVHADPSMLEERQRVAAMFLSGDWGVELSGFAEGRTEDRELAETRNLTWRR
jgi:plasmid stability protein